jgi:hypothetical protein
LSSLSTEDLIPADHPLRRIRVVVDAVLAGMNDTFETIYAVGAGAVSRAGDVVEVDGVDGAVLDPLGAGVLRTPQLRLVVQVVPGHANRPAGVRRDDVHQEPQRLLGHEVADEFFAAVVDQARLRRYVSSDHFSVGGTLLEALSFRGTSLTVSVARHP